MQHTTSPSIGAQPKSYRQLVPVPADLDVDSEAHCAPVCTPHDARAVCTQEAARVLGNLHRLEGAYRKIQNRILMLDTEISSKTAMIERDCDSVRGQLGKAELASLEEARSHAGSMLRAKGEAIQELRRDHEQLMVTQQLCFTFEQSPVRNVRSPTPQASAAVSGHMSPAQETAALMTRSIRQEMQSLKDQLDQAQSNEAAARRELQQLKETSKTREAALAAELEHAVIVAQDYCADLEGCKEQKQELVNRMETELTQIDSKYLEMLADKDQVIEQLQSDMQMLVQATFAASERATPGEQNSEAPISDVPLQSWQEVPTAPNSPAEEQEIQKTQLSALQLLAQSTGGGVDPGELLQQLMGGSIENQTDLLQQLAQGLSDETLRSQLAQSTHEERTGILDSLSFSQIRAEILQAQMELNE